VKAKELLYLFGVKPGVKTFGSEIRAFDLQKDGRVEYAQWLHPREREKQVTQEMVDELRRFLRPGDVAIDITLRVYERLQKEMPRKDPRFRLEHCTLVNDSLIKRIRDLGAIPTPFSTYAYYHGEKMKEYGAERLNHMFALRSFLDAGIRATQASDYPPGPFEPMMALQSEVTRTDSKGNIWGPKQRISLEEAIRVGTMNGAYASYEENSKGSIEAGKLADLVVLGRDPFKEDPSNIINIPIERTMTGGKWVFES